MGFVNPESQIVYHVEVPKMFETSWLFNPANNVGSMGHIRDSSLPQSSGVQSNFEGIHAIRRTMCTILKKCSGGFLSLCLV